MALGLCAHWCRGEHRGRGPRLFQGAGRARGPGGPQLRTADPGPLALQTPGVFRDGCACTFLSAEGSRQAGEEPARPGGSWWERQDVAGSSAAGPLTCPGAGRARLVPHEQVGAWSPPLAIGEGVTGCRR